MTDADVASLLALELDHITVYTDELDTAAGRFRNGYGFDTFAQSPATRLPRAIGMGLGDIRVVLCEPGGRDDPASAFVEVHGEGVADIAMSTPDLRAAMSAAVGRGAIVVAGPVEREGIVSATIRGFGDLTHTLVQRLDGADRRQLPGLRPVERRQTLSEPGLHKIDHFAVVLEFGQLEPAVEFYRQVLAFEMVFAERITVGNQAMNSQVVQSASGSVTFTLLEPDTGSEPGQIDGFLKSYGGPGVQHVAFGCDDIVAAVATMSARGVEFLTGPSAYYRLLAERMQPHAHSIDELRATHVLADEDHDGQLFQIFARSVVPRKTLFYELIERVGARTFGTRNITSLYEAVELERSGDPATEAEDG